MLLLELALLLDNMKDGINSILPIVSIGSILQHLPCKMKVSMYTYFSGCPSLAGGIPLLVLEDVLGTLGIEFFFCNAGGTVGMASTILVAWLLGTACWRTGDSCGISGSPVVS